MTIKARFKVLVVFYDIKLACLYLLKTSWRINIGIAVTHFELSYKMSELSYKMSTERFITI